MVVVTTNRSNTARKRSGEYGHECDIDTGIYSEPVRFQAGEYILRANSLPLARARHPPRYEKGAETAARNRSFLAHSVHGAGAHAVQKTFCLLRGRVEANAHKAAVAVIDEALLGSEGDDLGLDFKHVRAGAQPRDTERVHATHKLLERKSPWDASFVSIGCSHYHTRRYVTETKYLPVAQLRYYKVAVRRFVCIDRLQPL